MLNQSRVYVAANDPLPLIMALEQEAAFCIVGYFQGNRSLEDEIADIEPDLLILDGALGGRDGLKLLQWMQWNIAAPPRVVYLCRGDEAWKDAALSQGADAALGWPCRMEDFLENAHKVAVLPYGALCNCFMEVRLRLADDMLSRLQVPLSLKGRRYMKLAIAYGCCSPWMIQSFTHRLYPWIGQQCGAESRAVERAIRTAIENTWLRGNLDGIQDYFGLTVDADRGKPTNAEYLSMLAAHAYRQMNRFLRKQREEMLKKKARILQTQEQQK